MKNVLICCAIALGAISMTACSKSNDEIIEGGGNTGFKLSFTAVANSDSAAATAADADTRLSFGTGDSGKGLKASWEVTDKIDVYVGEVAAANKVTFDCESLNDNGTAVFSGTLPTAPKAGDKIYAYYHYDNNCVADNDNYRNCVYTNQSGAIDDLKNNCLMYAQTTYGLSLSLAFKHLYSVLKLKFVFADLAEGTKVSALGVTAASGLYSAAAYDASADHAFVADSSTATSLLTVAGEYTLDADKSVTVYLRTAHGAVTDIYGTATVGGVKYVSSSKIAAALEMQAGKVYAKSSVPMESTVATAFAGGDGSVDAPYEISNVKELRYMAQWINGNYTTNTPYRTKYYKLTADIDLGDGSVEWAPMGSSVGVYFGGTFDGCGHTISGTMKCTAGRYGGLFGIVYSTTAVIKNVNMACAIDCSAVTDASGAVVGMIDDTGASVLYCSNSGNITSSAPYVGGVIGNVGNRNGASVLQIIGCTNTGDIVCNSSSTYKTLVGGVCGNVSDNTYGGTSAVILGCVNTGRVSCASSITTEVSIGGVIGYISYCDILTMACCWSAAPALTGGKYVGAVVGHSRDTRTLDNCCYKAIDVPATNKYSRATFTNSGTFNDDAPTAEQIAAMNAAWTAADTAAGRTHSYQFNAATGAVEVVAE